MWATKRYEYDSLFGESVLLAPLFHPWGKPGRCPLDAELSVPAHCYADRPMPRSERCTQYCCPPRPNRPSITLTNLHLGRLKAEQSLDVLREHWAIEHHGNWTVDVIWDEDRKVWGGQGLGIQVLGWLRLMAYNVVSWLRCRYWHQREQTRPEKRRGQEYWEVLFLLICHAGNSINRVIPLRVSCF